jgi:hypothetical protein
MFKKLHLFIYIFFVISVSAQAQTASPKILQNIQQTFAELEANGNFGESLNQLNLNNLPAGLKKTVANMDVTLAVSKGEVFTTYTALDVYLRIALPERQTLFFAGKDIKLSHSGDIIGDAKVTLLDSVEIPLSGGNTILRLLGNFDKYSGQSQDLTYASIDCNGFKYLSISAEVELSPNLCQAVDNAGNPSPNERVKGSFKTTVSNWNDITAQVSFPPFMLNGLDDFIWTAKQATFDFSDLQTPQGIFPDSYRQYLIPGQENLWRGIYIKELSITLPPQFSKKDGKRTRFDAQNMLIDDNGVTGTFGVNAELLSINDGDASGWAFSLERFALTLLANNLEGAEFAGQIGLPVSEKTTLGYTGLIGADNRYALQVKTVDNLSFDFLGATAELDPNSYVLFTVDDKKFRPEAMLHGRMGVKVKMKPDDSKDIAELKEIEFRSMHLKTEQPYLTVEYCGYKGEVKIMNFPLSVSDIALTANEQEVSLGFNAQVTLGDVFKGETRLKIVGAIDTEERHHWRYDHVEISEIIVDAEIAETFYLKGEVNILREDPVYGDAFKGDIEMGFNKVLTGLKVNVRAMFGRTDFQYWFVDGIAQIPGGIPVFPSFFLNGFGGGVSYKMKPDMSKSGGSSTEITYVPDANTTLGIKASTLFAVVKKEVVQGEATFELMFNNKGGLSYSGLYGYAKFAGEIPGLENFQDAVGDKYKAILEKEKALSDQIGLDKLKQQRQQSPNEAAAAITDNSKVQGENGIMATAGIQFNFAENSFHSSFELYVNMSGGFLKGAGQNNKAGFAVIHIDPNQWYAHMGTPTDRIGLKLGVGSVNVETGSYLMAGTNIPSAPGLPQQVASILNENPVNLDYMNNLNALGEGKGFAFGSNFSISTGDLTFLILYANFSMGMGFDVLLKDYGETQCKGHSGAIGLDGWYANGQAYAYMHGELGVQVNLMFVKGRFPIISTDIAALMQAKLPNPTSFKTYLAAKAEILGGLVKVNCKFKMVLGDECELLIPGGSPLDMAIINDFSPTDRSGEISVFTVPQVTFNVAVEKSFTTQDDDGEKIYRVKLESFTLNNDNNTVIGNWKLNSDKDAALFYSHEVLPPQKTITATVTVIFEEWKGGRWNEVYTSGQKARESKTITFTTSDAPKYIPEENIVYSYPVIDQRYYLKNESNKGSIQLNMGQSYLFPTGMKNQVVYESNGTKRTVDVTYNADTKRVEYTIPPINNKTAYSIKIIAYSANEQISESGKATTEHILADNADLGTIDVNKKQAVSGTRSDVGNVLLSYNFATSAYSTLSDKINAIRKNDAIVEKISPDVLVFKYETKEMEPFEVADLVGSARSGNTPLIQASARLDDYLYTQKVQPLIYKDYPVSGQFRVTRPDAETIGVPPAKAISVISTYLTKIENNDFSGEAKTLFPFRYDLPIYYKADLIDLQSQVINNTLANSGSAEYRKWAAATFPFISAGNYRITLQYVTPNGTKGTSAEFGYKNFIE